MPIRKEFKNKQENSDNKIIYMSQEEFDIINNRIIGKEAELASASKEIGEATEQSSETWHDNAPFDAAVEKVGLLNIQLKELLNLRARSKITVKQNSNDEVRIGAIVEVLINKGIKKIFKIGGISDPSNGVITASSPIGSAIMGKKPGETGSFSVGQKKSIVEVLKIS